MAMPCRITDEHVSFNEELEDQRTVFKSLGEISLYDLGAEDLSVWVGKNKQGFSLHIEDEDGQPLVEEDAVNEYAMASMADFCRKFLHFYEKLIS